MPEHPRQAMRSGERHPDDRGAAPRRRRFGRFMTPRALILAAACLFGGAVVVNALMLQTGKHPTPLFSTVAQAPATVWPQPPSRRDGSNPAVKTAAFAPTPLTAARPQPIGRSDTGAHAPAKPEVSPADAATEALTAEIQRELGKRGYYKGEPDGKSGPMTTQAIRDFQFAQRVAIDGKASETLLRDIMASKVTMKDELLDLVRRASADDKPNQTILDIQRALNKAGYGPLTADGQMGPSTQKALAKFEADRKLPPRGEPKGPVLKLLASASGIPIKP
jgi:peptidoglycan hydrolase-like protein with peptidoglycan-binding domain